MAWPSPSGFEGPVATAIVPDGPAFVYLPDQEKRVPTVEEHVSPDARLRLRIDAGPDGDLALGFEGYPWHTHADILAAVTGLVERDAVRQFVDDILGDKAVIELRYRSGRAWVES